MKIFEDFSRNAKLIEKISEFIVRLIYLDLELENESKIIFIFIGESLENF